MADLMAAGVLCFTNDGKQNHYLVLRSAKHGEWGPPKGHADKGETEVETALRELYEESGLRRITFIPGFKQVLEYTVNRRDKKLSKEVIFFLANMSDEPITLSTEHTEAHMATLDEIEIMVPHEDLRELFRKAEAFLKKNSKQL